jgi:hypothetical protein
LNSKPSARVNQSRRLKYYLIERVIDESEERRKEENRNMQKRHQEIINRLIQQETSSFSGTTKTIEYSERITGLREELQEKSFRLKELKKENHIT